MYDTDRVVEVTDGEVDVHAWATERPHRLGRGDALLVPNGRLHGITAVSATAGVAVRSLEGSLT